MAINDTTPTNEAGHGLPELAAPAARNTPHPPAAASASERAWEILSLHAATNVRWVTTVQALAALEQALTQQRGECEALWCLHILGPDDVHPAPSKAHAEKAAERLNAFMESRKDRHPLDPECHAVAAPWPHSPESHAESVERFIAEWLTPNTPQPAAADGGEALARRFHETYERLAPSFGYETRTETRAFDPTTPNGRLMIAVCEQIEAPLSSHRQAGDESLYTLHARFLSDTSGLPEEWQDWRNDFARDIRALVEKGAGNG